MLELGGWYGTIAHSVSQFKQFKSYTVYEAVVEIASALQQRVPSVIVRNETIAHPSEWRPTFWMNTSNSVGTSGLYTAPTIGYSEHAVGPCVTVQELLNRHKHLFATTGFNPKRFKTREEWRWYNTIAKGIPVNGFIVPLNEEPGCSLPEHTDMMGPQNIGWQCNRGHKVHFVFEGDGCWTAHRRSKKTAAREFNFAVGGIYVYNNYVFHRVWNAGPDWRTHFVLMYADYQWKIKQALYKQIGVKNPSF